MKKVTLLSLSVLLSVLFGCSNPSQNANNKTIEVWHWMTDRHEALEELAARYEQETGVKVKFELFAPSDAYSQKITAAAQAHGLPDIYGVLDKKTILAAFIKAGFVADLTDAFQENNDAWEKSLFPKALASSRFEEGNIDNVKAGIYGVPLDVTNMQMVYNKNLLKKAGIATPPKTFNEFLTDIEALKRIGVPGFVSGFGELWLLECMASNYAFNIMGQDKIMATFRGEVPYTDPDWVKVFQVFKTLADTGAFMEGVVTKGNKFAEQDFALERAAFAFNGSWCVNVYKDMNPKLEYGVMLPPPISGKHPLKIWGGAGSSFVVNASSPRKAAAIAFLKWLTAKDQQVFLARETQNLPSNRDALVDIPPILSDFAGGMEQTTHPTTWPLNEDPLVTEAFTRGLQSIIIGEKTPAAVAQRVQDVKVRQMEKAKRRQNSGK